MAPPQRCAANVPPMMTEPHDGSARIEPDDDSSERVLHVRCHELAPAAADLEHNCGLIEDAIRDAMAAGTQLLVLPELATSGYHVTPEEARACALSADADVFQAWAGLLRENAVLVVGYAEVADGSTYNSAVLLTAGGIEGHYRKTHLWDTEKTVFTAGPAKPPIINTALGKVGILVCYDLEFPEMPRALALGGADIIAVPTNWPLVERPSNEHPPEVIQAMAAARSSAVAIACCDRRGEERGTSWTEGTAIIGTDGWLLGAKDADGIIDARVQLSASRRHISPRNSIDGDRRPEFYS